MGNAIVRRFGVLAAIAAFACGGSSPPVGPTPPPPPPPPPTVASFAFMQGNWDVTSRYAEDGGEMTQTAARAAVLPAINGFGLKETWIGEREGDPLEVKSFLIESENSGAWIIARGDGIAGTFDVLEGTFSGGRGLFTSRDGSRPDGGLVRARFEDITNDGFTYTLERSDDDGASWTVYWEMDYTRPGSGFSLPAAPQVATGCQAPEYAEFDFWEGSWSAGGTQTNDLEKLLGGCILEENWVSAETGTSFNMYDHRTEQWTQVWRDDNGYTLVLYGDWDGERMRLSGPRLGSLQRVTWTPNADGTVRQLGESSSSGGQAWSQLYDITYTPR